LNELGKRLFSVWRYLNWSMQRTETVSAIYRCNVCLVLPPEPVMSDSSTRVEPLVSDFIVSLTMARLTVGQSRIYNLEYPTFVSKYELYMQNHSE